MTRTYCDECGVETNESNNGYVYARHGPLVVRMNVEHLSTEKNCAPDLCAKCAMEIIKNASLQKQGKLP